MKVEDDLLLCIKHLLCALNDEEVKDEHLDCARSHFYDYIDKYNLPLSEYSFIKCYGEKKGKRIYQNMINM